MNDTPHTDLPSAYNPADIEDTWYRTWEERGYFHAEPRADGSAYTIVIPPPNITGMLTVGHVLNNTLQDVFIRWHRMLGEQTCWIPGTDHAGIATQTVVERALKAEEGKSRHDLGREAFLARVWEWRGKYGDIIIRQLRKLGVACDWERTVFTMDAALSAAVTEAFVRLYRKGRIYRGKRIINWDPVAHTALSDEEVNHREQQGSLWHIRYPLLDGGTPSATEYLVVATTRPETMLGDTAVAVHPKDDRYARYVGRSVQLPLMDRPIPVIADEYVDPAFGTGVVKITPAHDTNDYEVGLRHGLPQINVMDVNAAINAEGGRYEGQSRDDARRNIVADLEALGLLDRVEDYTHSVGFSDRTKVPVEPWLSDQWFVRMADLAAPALQAVRDGHVRFHPERWVKTYEHWMTNIRDWTISRQLWWGHRIPVWYCDACGWQDALTAAPDACPQCGSTSPRQDEDVLDTWFSSWLWPFSVHGWPQDSPALRSFYPTSLLVTAPDIIFFWVARMIMAGLEFMRDIPMPDGSPRSDVTQLVPFRDVYFTSIIRDDLGRKMSKSLGNSPDPLEVIARYSADALRFTVIYLAPLGQDVRFSHARQAEKDAAAAGDAAKPGKAVKQGDSAKPGEAAGNAGNGPAADSTEIGRNFANKLWNAARFLLVNLRKAEESGAWSYRDGRWRRAADGAEETHDTAPLELEDAWIVSQLHATLRAAREGMEQYRINDVAKALYDFVWHDFCDWYIELIKERLYADDEARRRAALARALGVFDAILKLLHPIMPFITEELWHRLEPGREAASIMNERIPACDPARIDAAVTDAMNFLQNIVDAVRAIRGEMNVPPSVACSVVVNCRGEERMRTVLDNTHFLERLARIERVEAGVGRARPKLSATAVVSGEEVFVPLAGLIDVARERARIAGEAQRIGGLLRGVEAKLANERFLAQAPADVVERERVKRDNYRATIGKLEATLRSLEEE